MSYVRKPPRILVLPSGCQERNYNPFQRHYLFDNHLSVITGIEEHDGSEWLHVSFARPDRLPSWNDLKEVKDLFIGRNTTAIQVFPRADKYVNKHPYCLHLFSCLKEDVLPDFTDGKGNI